MTRSGGVPLTTGTANVAGPSYLLPRRRPGHVGPLNLGQLLVAEAALVGVLAVLRQGILVILPAAVGASLLWLLVLSRQQGRWWLDRELMRRRFRRRRSRPAPPGADPRLATLYRLAPGLTVENVAAADGSQVGVARDGAGWFAAAGVEPGGWLRLDALVGALADVSQPGAVLQVVIHTVPGNPGMDASAPANQSYRQLLVASGATPVPADRAIWVAVRLDARLLAEAGTDQTVDLGPAPVVTTALLRRVTKELRRAGLRHQVLDADQLLTALARASDVAGNPAEPPREEWALWHSSALAHRSFWIRTWPPVASAGSLLALLADVPAAMTNVALTLVPNGDSVDLRCLFRVAAPVDRLADVCRAAVRLARDNGAELFPLDGEQAPAVYASAPTGGGAQ